jgi:hypothetical protein
MARSELIASQRPGRAAPSAQIAGEPLGGSAAASRKNAGVIHDHEPSRAGVAPSSAFRRSPCQLPHQTPCRSSASRARPSIAVQM